MDNRYSINCRDTGCISEVSSSSSELLTSVRCAHKVIPKPKSEKLQGRKQKTSTHLSQLTVSINFVKSRVKLLAKLRGEAEIIQGGAQEESSEVYALNHSDQLKQLS